MKIYNIIVLVFFINLSTFSQFRVNNKTTYHYQGICVLKDINGKIVKKYYDNNFTIKIDSSINKNRAQYIFLNKWFTTDVNKFKLGTNQSRSNEPMVCLLLFNECIYRLNYNAKYNILLYRPKNIIEDKIEGIKSSKMFNLNFNKKKSSTYTTKRYQNPYRINFTESSHVLIKSYIEKGKFKGKSYVLLDDSGGKYYNNYIYFSKEFAFLKFIYAFEKLSTPYEITYNLIGIE